MKKYILGAAALLGLALNAGAQTQLTQLIDSVTDWSSLRVQGGKLYLTTKTVGGEHYEVNTTTGAKTLAVNFPFVVGGDMYQAITEDFRVMNGRFSKIYKKSTGESYLLAGVNTSIDTLISLSAADFFADVKQIGNKIVVTTDRYIYSTDLTQANTVLLDSFGATPHWNAGATYQLYLKKKDANDRYIMRTNGITTEKVDSVSGGNYYVDLIGEDNGDYYYTVTLNAATPTITLKKSNATTVSATVNTFSVGGMPVNILVGSHVTAIGLGKIFLMIKSNTSPFYNDLYSYDIAAAGGLTKLTSAGPTLTFSGVQNKAAFSDKYFYFETSGANTDLWLTDGTAAGTRLYRAKTDIRFYDPNYNYFNQYLTGIFCGDYPLAGINTEPAAPTDVEYHYGVDTGLVKYNLNPTTGSYAGDFVKLGTEIFFIASAGTTTKRSLYKVDGCTEPTLGVQKANGRSLSLNVYPNPARDVLYVDGLPSANAQISLSNIQGQRMSVSIDMSGHRATVNTTNLTPGIYFLQVRDGDAVTVQKVVVQ